MRGRSVANRLCLGSEHRELDGAPNDGKPGESLAAPLGWGFDPTAARFPRAEKRVGWGERPWPQGLGWVPRKTKCWYRVASGAEAREWRSPPPNPCAYRFQLCVGACPKSLSRRQWGSSPGGIRGGTGPSQERSKLSFSLQEAACALYAQARTAADRIGSLGGYKRSPGETGTGHYAIYPHYPRGWSVQGRAAMREDGSLVWRAEQNQSHLSAAGGKAGAQKAGSSKAAS